jgi:hypothetical protein
MEFPEPWHSRHPDQWPRLAKAISRLNRMRLRKGLGIKYNAAPPVLAYRLEGPAAQRFEKILDQLPMRWGIMPMHPHPASTIDLAIARLPKFTTAPTHQFAGFAGNEHRVFVLTDTAEKTPVAMVSKTYQLVQHAEILASAKDFLRTLKCPLDSRVRIQLSTHGERMVAQIELGEKFTINPDGHPVRLHLLVTNTVDGGGSMQASLHWFRLICMNSLKTSSWHRSQLRHSSSTIPGQLFRPLLELIEDTKKERDNFERWQKKRIDLESVRAWADGIVASTWGKLSAARVWSIATTGQDAAFASPHERVPPSYRTVVPTRPVPGAPLESRTLYDVVQVLSWIASHRPDFDQGQVMQNQIESLIQRLN